MGYLFHGGVIEPGFTAASNILPRQPVKHSASSAGQVLAAGTAADRPLGIVAATVLRTENGPVYGENNVEKAVAGASVGPGQEVMIGSDNGALIPAVAASFFAASGHWAVGVTREAGAAADVISVYIKPRKA